MMVQNTVLSPMLELFFYKLIAPKNQHLPAPNTPKYSFFTWCSFSPFTDSRICRFKHILQHGPYNVSSIGHVDKHDSQRPQVDKKWWTASFVFGKQSFTSQNHHHHHHNPILTKLGTCSIRSLFSKPENYSTPNIFSNLTYDFFSTPSAASGISVLKRSSYLLFSLGALRHYHNYRRASRAPKNYKPARIRRYNAPKKYSVPVRILRYIAPKKNSKLGRIMLYLKPVTRFMKHVHNHRILYLVGGGTIPTIIFGRLETVPYTKRKHILVVPPSKDKLIGDFFFDESELSILPWNHPDSVRVRSVSNQILHAIHTELKFKGLKDSDFSLSNVTSTTVDKNTQVQVPWWKEVLVPWRRIDKLSTGHLDGLKWQVVVVDEPVPNAYCLPGGKIVVYTGLLKRLKSDAEVATVIGHEVGHIVARHTAETLTRELWIIIGRIIFWFFWAGRTPNHHITELLRDIILNFPWSRRNEKEADYIGLLVMASAGYDPREAPKVYRMFDKIFGKSSDSEHSDEEDIDDFLSTHPSGRKRAEELSKSEVMEEAMARYSEVIETRRRNQLKVDKSNILKDSLASFYRRVF